jgi:hypothetical protein
VSGEYAGGEYDGGEYDGGDGVIVEDDPIGGVPAYDFLDTFK